MTNDKQAAQPWHALELSYLFAQLTATEEGLSEGEARARLSRYGPNALPHEPPPAWWQILLRQFRNPLIYILGLAAVVSLASGHASDAVFIASVLSLNAAIGGYQEWRAEKHALALQQLLKIRASVQRDGEVSEIDAEAIVPGDIVWLESGNRVPADVRLLSAHGLEIDESLLTGESLAVLKDPAWPDRNDSPHLAERPEGSVVQTGTVPVFGNVVATPLADRTNMAHAGSIVARGRAKGLVVATGTATAVGQLALDVMQATGGKPPLLVRMEKFTHAIAVAVLIAAAIVGVCGVALQGYGWADMFLFAVALAVSAIPEGLPIALTVALAIATTRMARRGVIVRKLTAVEGLGSCTLVATDKTGTLTCNELTVCESRLPSGEKFEVTGEGFAPAGHVLRNGSQVEPGSQDELERLARAAVLCNEADLHHRNGSWAWRGDAVDIAFLSMAHKLGWNRETSLDRYPQINQIPFEPERQFAASYHLINNRTMVLVKGGPERVLAMCELTPEVARHQMKAAEEMAGRGLRVLALAEGVVSERLGPWEAPSTPSGLTFLGFVGMIDPLRPGVREAIRACRAAGVQVCMVTGDHRITALAIAHELGLADSNDQVVTGKELEQITTEHARKLVERLPAAAKNGRWGTSFRGSLADLLARTTVFARVAPQQKLQIVEAARQAGHFVAVTGDGVNDAPALRHANIGVAMGKSGTDVAREAAELVISDDNFSTLVAGIEEGRIAYDNVRKVIYLLVSTGAAEIVLVGLAVVTGTPLPLLPVQLLWLNLVTNGIQDVALAFEPGEADVLQRRPRPTKERIFNRLMIERTVVAALVMGLVGFSAFAWMLQAGMNESAARNALLLLMVLFENVHIGNCRSETQSAFKLSPLRSPILLTGTMIAFAVHVAALYLPAGHSILKTQPVGPTVWVMLFCLALTIFVAMEVHKLSWTWRQKGQASRAVAPPKGALR